MYSAAIYLVLHAACRQALLALDPQGAPTGRVAPFSISGQDQTHYREISVKMSRMDV
jgi:hypothetical protein